MAIEIPHRKDGELQYLLAFDEKECAAIYEPLQYREKTLKRRFEKLDGISQAGIATERMETFKLYCTIELEIISNLLDEIECYCPDKLKERATRKRNYD